MPPCIPRVSESRRNAENFVVTIVNYFVRKISCLSLVPVVGLVLSQLLLT